MGLLEKQEISKFLYEFYIETYGELETDKWFEQPAANIWTFERDGKIITLKCHILTGEVEAKEEML